MPVPLNVCGCRQMPVPFKCVDVAVDASPFQMCVDDNGCHLFKMWMSQWMSIPLKYVWMSVDASPFKTCGCQSL